MLTTTGHRLPGAPGRLVTETAAWGALIVLVAISYVVAGTSGLVATVGGRAYTAMGESLSAGGFDNQMGSLSLLIVFTLSCAGLFIPAKVFASRPPAVRKTALSISAIVEAAILVVLSLAPSAWLTWVAALFLGAVVGLLMSINPFRHEKPWRRVGIPAAVLVFVSCAFQILGGSAAGTQALGWVSLLVGIGMAAGSVIIFLTPERALHAESATTGQFPELKARVARPAESISNPWVCIGLFAVLGATFMLAQPTAIGHGYGQAGFAVIIACCLVGWAIGFEMGPTFAPGMSRPRVSTFALLVSGVLLLATGSINELSGKVVLSAAIAFLVGIGVRAQPYDFSRRYGAVAGAGLALVINALDLGGTVEVGSSPDWVLAPSDVAFIVFGIAALIAGIIGLFTFDPHRLQGLSVDIVHGFRPPSQPETASGGLGNSAERLGAGFFIAIEGGDGSGKSTQIKRISAALADDGYHVESTREPGGTELGTKIRSVLFDSDPPSPRTEALLFAADRAHHVASLVDPSLDAGNIVITDRYIDSTIAYQSAGRSFDEKTILALSRWATQGLVPNLTIVLDIEPEVAAERMGKRGDSNYLDQENQQFHQRVRQTYLSRAHKELDRYVVLDASVDADELTEQILAAIRARLPQTLVKRDTGTEAAPASTSIAEADSGPERSSVPIAAVAAGTADEGDPAEADDVAADADSGESSSDVNGESESDDTAADGNDEADETVADDSDTDENDTSGDDAVHERGPRFVPASGDRFVPSAVTDADAEISGAVPTERVDLGADLRDDPTASASEESTGASNSPAPTGEAADRESENDEKELPTFLEQKGARRSDEDEATTVLPAHGSTSEAIIDDSDDADGVPTDRIATDDEAETRIVNRVDPDEAETRVVHRPEPAVETESDDAADDSAAAGDAETTVLPARTAREMSRERLQAQAEIERQARERLRRQRERSNRRFTNREDS
ncbi:dTMP kinase [Brevibacterium linens]|uniref:Thymidylate kinase n=1 Tax=Brevibacterium linens ATCC 9172 TaxID=1255617 RepID=A0A2H1KCR3_BRELN|nr:dTMP kinase [Brevibacterium linens]KAB1945466.1 dTMP kinase [Brevibacterium linens ATCC 9172]SMX97476.1 Thymidylate kinase [Brevibacterium linens ATCC 9172]